MTLCRCCLASKISHRLFALAIWLGDLSDTICTVAERVADWGSRHCRG